MVTSALIHSPAHGIIHSDNPSGSLRMLPTDVKDVVSIEGSFPVRKPITVRDRLTGSLTVAMLDKGTKSKTKYELSDQLESRGASLTFVASDTRVSFGGRFLRKDTAFVLDILLDQLSHPAFDEAEFENVRNRYRTRILRGKSDTGSRAFIAFRRMLYPEHHPNLQFNPDDRLEALEQITLQDLKNFHRSQFGNGKRILVAAGDTDTQVMTNWFEKWESGVSNHVDKVEVPKIASLAAARNNIELADKPNISVIIGQPAALRKTDAGYLPMRLGVHVLGGNFSARLMKIVRDKMGLTYGINARLSGVTSDYAGNLAVSASFSTNDLENGIEATLKELDRFVAQGITDDELAEMKETVAGGYLVGLSTTGGLTSALHIHAIDGFEPDYLKTYPEKVGVVTLSDTNETLRQHLTAGTWAIAAAGTIHS